MELLNNPHLERSFRMARLMATLMVAGQLMYVVAIELLQHFASNAIRAPMAELPLLKAIFYGAAILTLFVSVWLRNRLLGSGAELQQMVAQILDPQLRQQQMVKATQVAMSVAGAPGVLALALFVMGGTRSDCYPLIALALIAQARLYPRRQEWEQWYAQRSAYR